MQLRSHRTALPNELLFQVFVFLPKRDIRNVVLCCKHFQEVVTSDYFYHLFLETKFVHTLSNEYQEIVRLTQHNKLEKLKYFLTFIGGIRFAQEEVIRGEVRDEVREFWNIFFFGLQVIGETQNCYYDQLLKDANYELNEKLINVHDDIVMVPYCCDDGGDSRFKVHGSFVPQNDCFEMLFNLYFDATETLYENVVLFGNPFLNLLFTRNLFERQCIVVAPPSVDRKIEEYKKNNSFMKSEKGTSLKEYIQLIKK